MMGLEILWRTRFVETVTRRSGGMYRRQMVPVYRVRCRSCGASYLRTGWRSDALRVKGCATCARRRS